MTKFSLEHLIRNIMNEEHKSVDQSQLDEFVKVNPGVLKSLRPLVKPKDPKIVPKPEPEVLPKIKPEAPSVPKEVPSTPKVSPKAEPPVAPKQDPSTPKQDPKAEPNTGIPSATPNNSETTSKAKEKKDEEPDLGVGGGAAAPIGFHKGTRVPVKTGISIAKKRKKLHFEELETKNRKLVSVVKKAVDDKSKKKPSKKNNNVVDLHPTLNEPDERDQEVR